MSEGDPLPWPAKRFPPLYAYFYMIAVPRARELGWALGLHGSLARDLDIMAMPWTEDAASEEALVSALKELADNSYDNVTVEEKPHGRRAYAIPWEAGAYIDLSIMLRREPR